MARVGPQRHRKKKKKKNRSAEIRRRRRWRRKKYERNGCKHYTVISCPEMFLIAILIAAFVITGLEI